MSASMCAVGIAETVFITGRLRPSACFFLSDSWALFMELLDSLSGLLDRNSTTSRAFANAAALSANHSASMGPHLAPPRAYLLTWQYLSSPSRHKIECFRCQNFVLNFGQNCTFQFILID